MSEQARQLSIGEVVRQAGVKTSTVRYYEALGVLPEPERVATSLIPARHGVYGPSWSRTHPSASGQGIRFEIRS